MKKLFIILLSALSLTAFAQQKKVAVYVTGADAGINKVLGSKLVSAIARSEEYSAIERTESFLAELSKEQNYQRTGAVDDSELSRLGKQFGVQYICVAAVSDAFNEKYISARLIDVETAQVERTASSGGAIQSLDGIISAANSVSNDLLSSLSKERQSNLKKVAVYVVKNEAGRNIGRVLGDKLVAGFTNSGRYIAIERTNSFLSQLSKEQNYQRTGAVDDSELSRLGKQFGVQYVCVADISDVLGEKFISARLIDVETAEVVNSYDTGGNLNSMTSCLNMTKEIATNLSKGSFKEQEEDARRQKQEEIENKKKYYQEMIELKGYIVVKKNGEEWMVCINTLKSVTANEILSKNKYSRLGYSDWQIGDIGDFYLEYRNIAEEIRHYLGATIPIFEGGRYFAGIYNDYYVWKWRTSLTARPNKRSYLDGIGDGYEFSINDPDLVYYKEPDIRLDAILVRKIR